MKIVNKKTGKVVFKLEDKNTSKYFFDLSFTNLQDVNLEYINLICVNLNSVNLNIISIDNISEKEIREYFEVLQNQEKLKVYIMGNSIENNHILKFLNKGD